MSELPPCRGAMNKNDLDVPCSRRGLLAYVYSGVSNKECLNECLSGGNCSYIVRLSVRDLHSPTQPITKLTAVDPKKIMIS